MNCPTDIADAIQFMERSEKSRQSQIMTRSVNSSRCSSSKYRVFRNVWSIRSVLIQALTCCVTEREEQRRRGKECRKERKSVLLRQSRQSRRTRREYEVAGALCCFCTNATSGIMRRRRLMCESRKERSDGIAIATKSIASSSLPAGLCRLANGGNT